MRVIRLNQFVGSDNSRESGEKADMKKVYLAGPMVFWEDVDGTFSRMKDILLAYDLLGVAPVDNQESLKGIKPGDELNSRIYQADVEIMNNIDAAIFNITPFRRGTEMDTGTAFEVGYCASNSLPMTGWTTDSRTYPELVNDHFESLKPELLNLLPNNQTSYGSNKGASSGLERDPDGIVIHSQGQYQNLMVQVAIERSGAKISFDRDWVKAFEMAAHNLSNILI